MVTKAKVSAIAIAAVIVFAGVSSLYAGNYWSKTISGVDLTAQSWMVDHLFWTWSGGADSDSTEAIAIAVENYGMEYCDLMSLQRWYSSHWQNHATWASASGGFAYLTSDFCEFSHTLASEGEHLFFDSGYGISETPYTEDWDFPGYCPWWYQC
ncbi:MAG: hypothetical protein HY532_07570 [Chloroflexi bacterium]|nr:hypothetical protein [Chloroflexota bacterium]